MPGAPGKAGAKEIVHSQKKKSQVRNVTWGRKGKKKRIQDTRGKGKRREKEMGNYQRISERTGGEIKRGLNSRG